MCWIDHLVGVLILEFDRAPVSERGVEPALVVDHVDEARAKQGICTPDRGERIFVCDVQPL